MLNASCAVPEVGPELELGANPGRADVDRTGGLDGFVRTCEAVVGSVNGAWSLSSTRDGQIVSSEKMKGIGVGYAQDRNPRPCVASNQPEGSRHIC